MKEMMIIGAGGFGREVQWLIERINAVTPKWYVAGFIDDGVEAGSKVNNLAVLGGMDYLLNVNREIAVVCTIAAPDTRKEVINRLKNKINLYYPNLIDPSVIMSDRITIGDGNIICAGNILTVNIKINNFVIINLDCTVGHDVILDDFITIYPSVNISGNVTVEELSQLGTGAQVIQGQRIHRGAYVGAGAVVVKDVDAGDVAVGCPAKSIKKRERL